MDAEDGHLFVKNLASFVRTHEKALANALQLQRNGPRKGSVAGGNSAATSPTHPPPPTISKTASIAAALSLSSLSFSSPHNLKPVKLTLTPHHLFYLLSRFEELGVAVGPMNVRLENIHTNTSPAEYVSFLSQAQRRKAKQSDHDSVHSVSSLRSVMSGMSSFWSGFGLTAKSAAKTEKQTLALKDDMKYLYSAFTKIPCLKLAPDHKARLISGYEEFPFDTAVPLFAFKNLSALEIVDVDFRQFYGWDRMADQLRSLTVKNANLNDPLDLLSNIVFDDMDKRRRKAAKAPGSPTAPLSSSSPKAKHVELARNSSDMESQVAMRRTSTEADIRARVSSDGSPVAKPKLQIRPRSTSPTRPMSSKRGAHHNRPSVSNLRRPSGSSGSSVKSDTPRGSTSNLLAFGSLPSSKWRFLRHLSIADNALTTITVNSLAPVSHVLQSLDLSSNLFTEIPESLASLTSLKALNMSDCMIDSLHSLLRNPLPAVTTLNLRKNRLTSLAGIEKLPSLERVDFRDNKLTDPTELARLTGMPNIREVYINRNPFTKTHHNYRVTIFNVFRAVPGYSDDILIDCSPPSYSERKQLIDRVPEFVSVPAVKAPLEEEVDGLAALKPTVVVLVPETEPTSKLDAATTSLQANMGYAVASQKRRKGAKRRIVELSQEQESVPAVESDMPQTDGTAEAPPAAEPAPLSKLELPPSATETLQRPPPHTAQTQPNVATTHSLALEPATNASSNAVPASSRSVSDVPILVGDTYRKRVEALRNDLGPAWLSALTDESWDSAPLPHAHPAVMAPPLRVRTQSQSMVTTGRTIG